MNKNTTYTIVKFAIVITVLALFLFFITNVNAPSFIAVCLTLFFCSAVFVFAVVRLRFFEEEAISGKAFALSLAIWFTALAICVIIKWLIAQG